ncbi:MAG: hypothetical protein OZ920_04570 [Burkholderiales bacterium]|nr:hypothetical protein [Burkholderiales bacterium]
MKARVILLIPIILAGTPTSAGLKSVTVAIEDGFHCCEEAPR